jgi:DNA mismatch repair ATPase MutS
VKAHLLHRDRDFDFGAALPPQHDDLVRDLELSTVLDTMAGGDTFVREVSTKVLLRPLTDPGEVTYRQDVLSDCVAHPEVIREMYALAGDALADKRGFWGLSSRLPQSILAGAVSQLEAFAERLETLRRIADDHVDEVRSEGVAALFAGLRSELDDEYLNSVNRHLRQLRFDRGELLSARLGRDSSGVDYVLRSSGKAPARWKERLGMQPRSSYSFSIAPRDEAGAQSLSDLSSRGINLVANAAARSSDHIGGYFAVLRAELAFYVGCLNLRDRLDAKGEPTTPPVPLAWDRRRFVCHGLCDVALACRSDERVVGNDVDAGDVPLVLVTGANSGGKSTFLRSVGQGQLMAQCGMFVAADNFESALFGGIFTHFIREEDPTMTSGRFDEELGRMSTIAERIRPGGLALFNESFAATNEREGSEIGRQVIRALVESDVTVVFVTHHYDLAHSFEADADRPVLFLRAERSRDFKLVAAPPLPTSFGEDLYHRAGGWLDEDRDGDGEPVSSSPLLSPPTP